MFVFSDLLGKLIFAILPQSTVRDSTVCENYISNFQWNFKAIIMLYENV